VVFLDASAIVYLLEGDGKTRATVQQVLKTLRPSERALSVAVSALSRLECRAGPLRTGDESVLTRYDAFFEDPGLTVIVLDTMVVDRATELRAHYGLRTPDALQAASALAADEQPAFVTGDQDFRPVAELELHRVTVDSR